MPKCIESIQVYGPSGSGKTTQVAELGLHVTRRMKKKLRLISASGGGWTAIQPYVDNGIVIPLYLRDRSNPFQTLHRLTQGWWPDDPANPESQLMPPKNQKDYMDIGAWAYDSTTEICEWIMADVVSREARGEIRVSTESLPAKFKDGDTWFGTPARASFGTIQNNIAQFIAQSKGLPGVYIMWTALELKTTDELGKVPVYAPEIIGKAKSSIAPAWFDDTLHLQVLPAEKGKGQVRRMWLTQHYDENDRVPYIAKCRAPKECPLPDYLDGPDCSLGVFLEKMEAAQQRASQILREKLKGTI